MSDENWQKKAQAFINAFEKLKLQLQFFWRSKVGNWATDGAPWNGMIGEVYPFQKQGYIKRDCPIVLHFWANGHIGKYTPGCGIYLYSCCFPESSMISKNNKGKIKGNLKKYVYSIFHKNDLKKCALFLNQNFCNPISILIVNVIEN